MEYSNLTKLAEAAKKNLLDEGLEKSVRYVYLQDPGDPIPEISAKPVHAPRASADSALQSLLNEELGRITETERARGNIPPIPEPPGAPSKKEAPQETARVSNIASNIKDILSSGETKGSLLGLWQPMKWGLGGALTGALLLSLLEATKKKEDRNLLRNAILGALAGGGLGLGGYYASPFIKSLFSSGE